MTNSRTSVLKSEHVDFRRGFLTFKKVKSYNGGEVGVIGTGSFPFVVLSSGFPNNDKIKIVLLYGFYLKVYDLLF